MLGPYNLKFKVDAEAKGDDKRLHEIQEENQRLRHEIQMLKAKEEKPRVTEEEIKDHMQNVKVMGNNVDAIAS